MFPTDVPTAATALPAPSSPSTTGYFTKGDPAHVPPIPATILDQDYMNMLMLELINVVIAGGLTPSKSTYTQVRDAINILIAASTGAALLKAQNLNDLANKTTALNNLGFTWGNNANGYWEKLPSGVIRQRGAVAGIAGNSNGAVTFPIPFPSHMIAGNYILDVTDSTGDSANFLQSITTNGFVVRNTTGTGGATAYWQADGV